MKEWNDFFVAVSGTSAALTGLIFVDVSISLAKILSVHGLPDRALLSLTLLVNSLVQSLLFLVPGLAIHLLGYAILPVSVLVWMVVFRLDLRNVQGKEKQYKRQRLFNMAIDQVATTGFIITGAGMINNWTTAMYWMVPSILVSIVKAVFDGWALLVEINR